MHVDVKNGIGATLITVPTTLLLLLLIVDTMAELMVMVKVNSAGLQLTEDTLKIHISDLNSHPMRL